MIFISEKNPVVFYNISAKTRYIDRATVVYPEILDYVLETEILITVRDIRYMYREILVHGTAGAYKGEGAGVTGTYSG